MYEKYIRTQFGDHRLILVCVLKTGGAMIMNVKHEEFGKSSNREQY
jgi:hypothetical protein